MYVCMYVFFVEMYLCIYVYIYIGFGSDGLFGDSLDLPLLRRWMSWSRSPSEPSSSTKGISEPSPPGAGCGSMHKGPQTMQFDDFYICI